jgi:acyl-homoserine lactone acylase PvdQ
MTTKKTRTKMRIRTRLIPVAAIFATLLAGNALFAQKGAYAVVAASVFRESGFSLPGATVTLMAKGAAKGKSLRSTTDARGEFAFRIPPAAGDYLVTASMKGFKTAQAEASIGGEERVDVTLVLSTESK